MKRIFWLCAAVCLLLTLCACGPQMPHISTDPVSADTPPTSVGKPSAPAPGTRLTLSDVMGEMGATMRWSAMSNYEHTRLDAVSAVFPVSDAEGNECTLTVTLDEAADTLTSAQLSYGDVSINILTDDTMVIREIMKAMDEG